ncbi:hypothetical protein BBP40_004024 [Aspergillus hancockii]|nr:hypothetical protein BBP40_004024 [Aspergillus hancockii]
MDMKADLIGCGRVGCVIRYGEIAAKTANKWTVPDNASEYTTIVYQQINMPNEESLEHDGRLCRHLAHVEGVLKPLQISDTEIRMPYVSHRWLDTESKTCTKWPTSERFPDTSNVFMSDVIRKCWLEDGFGSMKDVCAALLQVN